MITTNTTAAYDNYTTYGGTFYAGGRVTSKDLNGATQTFTYDFPRTETVALKETSMFTTRIHQYIDGTFGVDVLYKDKIVATAQRTWKRYEKAQAAGENLVAAAVSKLFDLE